MSLRGRLDRFIRWLTEPRSPICRQRVDDCRYDPYWDYF